MMIIRLALLWLLAVAAFSAVNTTTSSAVYTGTGSTSVYPYTWGIAKTADLTVWEMTSGATITHLVLTTDYTVSGAGIPTGGNVTLVAGNLAAGTKLFIASDPLEVQTLVLQQGGGFNPADIAAALDLLTREVQATRRVANNSIQIPLVESLTGYNTTLPAVSGRANLYVGFNASGVLSMLPGGGGSGGTGHFIDVGDYGALPDGTTDNSPLFQNAITALPAFGGYLVIRSGASFYKITSGLDFTGHNNVTIWSNGATIKVAASYVDTVYNTFPNYGKDSILRFYQNTNVTIAGPLTLDANIQNRTAHAVTESFNSDILLSGVVGAIVRDVTCNNGMTDGITVVRDAGNVLCANVIIENCHCDSNRRNGLSLVDQNHVTVDSSSFTNTGSNQGVAPKAGIDIEPDRAAGCSLDITVRKCFLDGNKGTYALSIGGKGTTGYTIDNNIIHVSLTGGSGINANATVAFTSTNGRISNNLIDLSTTVVPTYGGAGMRIVAKNVDRITGNRVLTFITGIGWFDCDGGIVDKNYFKGNGYGVSFGDVSDPLIRAYCLANTFEDNTNANAGGTWFAMDGYPASASAEIEFSDNIVRNTSGNVDLADGAKLTGAYKSTCIAYGHNNAGYNLLNTYAVVSGDFRCAESLSIDGAIPYRVISGQDINYEVGRIFIGDKVHFWSATIPVADPVWGKWQRGDVVYNTNPAAGNAVAWICRTTNSTTFDPVYSIFGTPDEGMIPCYTSGALTFVSDKRVSIYTSSLVAADFSDGSLHTFLMDPSAGDLAITFPHPSTYPQREIEIINSGTANRVLLNRTAPSTFLSYAPAATAIWLNVGEKVILVADSVGDQWVVKSSTMGGTVTASQTTYTNFTTTATYQQLNTVTLTPGDWNVFWTVTFSANAATLTAGSDAIIALSTTTASATGAVEGSTIEYLDQGVGATNHQSVSGNFNIAVAASTAYYLNGQATFTVGNPQYVSRLWARRVR